MSRLGFQLEAEASQSQARAGRFRTLHNEVLTPIFMPVGTQAAVRGMRKEELAQIDAQILLANTYHLMLRPGPEVFRRLGGIHRFTGWSRSFLTDSGGFQIFSMPEEIRSITEEGATLRSYVDGRPILLSPESSISMQRDMGSDIMMVLDECVPSTSTREVAVRAMHRTHRWARRSLSARGDSPQSMFGIVQGACFEDLRRESAAFLVEQGFDGLAIGGLAVGETKGEREEFTGLVARLLPKNLPRYLMGVGTPLDLLEAVHRGVDMFDCIIPTAHAQQGRAYTFQGIFDLYRSAYKFDASPVDAQCGCYCCQQYSRAYLHHLCKADEPLGGSLLAYHNLYFYRSLMREMREKILGDEFLAYYNAKREDLGRYDSANPASPSIRKKEKPPVTLNNYEMILTREGHHVIQQRSSGEAMHPTGAPDAEAEAVYVKPSRLIERIAAGGEEPLIIWDVGLGAAHNAMAVVRAVEGINCPNPRPVVLISFENDLDSLRLALRYILNFPHLKHAGPHLLLRDGEWRSKTAPLHWRLLHGDFSELLYTAPKPELIFFDPFSSKTDDGLWTLSSFQAISDYCAERPTELFTYSTSTAVRATMLAAHFFVAAGQGAGKRAESTIAMTALARQQSPEASYLDQRWLARWERSSARFPVGVAQDNERREDFERRIRTHPQFTK